MPRAVSTGSIRKRGLTISHLFVKLRHPVTALDVDGLFQPALEVKLDKSLQGDEVIRAPLRPVVTIQ